MKTKRILFIIPDLNSGGSQKFIINLLNLLSNKNNFDLYLFACSFNGEFINEIPSNVTILNKKNIKTRNAFFLLLKTIKKLKPEITFSVLHRTNILNIAASVLSNSVEKIIVRESNSPIILLENKTISYFTLFLCKIFYKFSDIIISQTDEMKEDILTFYGTPKNKIITIHNPVNTTRIDKIKYEKVSFNSNIINLVSVGRLEYQKGYDLSLRALKILVASNKNFLLHVIGETKTNYFSEILTLTKELGIENNVKFYGYNANPYKFIQNADVFVLTSYWEGLPNVLLEAKYIGTPVVVTNVLSFYENFLEKNDGYLTDKDPKNISNAILKALNLKNKPKNLKHFNENYELFLNQL